MDPGPSPSSSLPFHVVVTVLQFAIPEVLSLGEARLLCKGASSSLASPSFWRGMTVNLTRDEGYEAPLNAPRRPQHDESSRKAAAFSSSASSSSGGRASAPRVTASRPRSNADCLLGGIGAVGLASSQPAGCHSGCASGAGTRKRNRAAGAAGAEGTASGATARRQFLRRYHHHVAFRRLTPPVTSTEIIDTPVPLYPTCLDACGNMVALGTREGPVLLFDTTYGSGGGGGGGGSGGGGSSGNCRDGAPPALETNAVAGRSTMTPGVAAAARVPGKAATPTIALAGSSNRSESTASVTRVYGSLADETGPITAVLLDRAKVIAAGRGSRRSGGGFVVRIYAVDSTRLLRTLRCLSEVSRMSLFDPVLAVLSSGSGRLSFRDLYADGGGGLGQRTAMGVSAAAFAAVEGHLTNTNNNTNNTSSNTGSIRPDYNGDGSTVLHCVNSTGTVFEASTSGAAWNSELIAPGGSEGGAVPAAAAAGAAVGGGWHVCADLEAFLLVLATPWGTISGWRLHPSGRRARGPIFCFGLGSSCSASPSPSSRPLTSMSLAAAGLILATSAEGTPPRLWDMRLARRRCGWGLAADVGGPSETGGARAFGLRGASAGGGGGGSATAAGVAVAGAGAGAAAAGSTRQEGSADDADDRGGRVTAGRARCVGVRPWLVGAWAIGVAANAGSGRLVSACSDGRMRITQLRPNSEEQRLRAAVLAARQAKQQAATRGGDAP
ncbi:unnamed protein product [Ectocarpus sp. 4 AP-2014]